MARYGLTRSTLHSDALIWTTVGINIVGSFLLGVLAAEHWFSRDIREALGVGFLGGFTTFSTFSVQIVLEGRRRKLRQGGRLPCRLRRGRDRSCRCRLRARAEARLARRGREALG